jgi:hypothetical protein
VAKLVEAFREVQRVQPAKFRNTRSVWTIISAGFKGSQ